MRKLLYVLVLGMFLVALMVVFFFSGRRLAYEDPTTITILKYDTTTQKFNESQVICYPHATHAQSCNALVKQNYHYIVDTMLAQRRPTVAPISPPQAPECTKCDTNAFGKLVCTTTQSWVCL